MIVCVRVIQKQWIERCPTVFSSLILNIHLSSLYLVFILPLDDSSFKVFELFLSFELELDSFLFCLPLCFRTESQSPFDWTKFMVIQSPSRQQDVFFQHNFCVGPFDLFNNFIYTFITHKKVFLKSSLCKDALLKIYLQQCSSDSNGSKCPHLLAWAINRTE